MVWEVRGWKERADDGPQAASDCSPAASPDRGPVKREEHLEGWWMADFTGAMDEGWLEESHYKMSKKIAQLTRVLARVCTRRCLQRRCCAPPAACPAFEY